MGRPIKAARAEVLKSAKGLRYYADHAEEFLSPEPLADPSAVGASVAGTRYAPIGIVLAVMPWNYPLWQVLRFAGPALMAGNTGLLKHASNVPQAALYLDTLFDNDRLDAALDALYRRPLREAATQMLANALRERTPDELGDLIVMLHEEDRLCVDDSDLEEDDLRIVCSLGLKSER